MNYTRHFVRLILIFTLLCSSVLARADVTGSVLGTVVDEKGATVPNARVVLVNSKTGYRRTLLTDAAGAYDFFPFLSEMDIQWKSLQLDSKNQRSLVLSCKLISDSASISD